MSNKEKTVVYESKGCEHINLKKIAPLWYLCSDCGLIFMVPFTLQFSREMAIEHLGRVIVGINDNKELIRNAEKAVKEQEKKEEQEAINNSNKEVKCEA